MERVSSFEVRFPRLDPNAMSRGGGLVQPGVQADTPPGPGVSPEERQAEGFVLALCGVPLNYNVRGREKEQEYLLTHLPEKEVKDYANAYRRRAG
jgi:hypothetical protein